MGETGRLLVRAVSMKIIIGLGNPGVEYQMTRHNVGVMLVDKMFNVQYSMFNGYGWRKHFDAMVFKTEDLWLVKTKDVFMNESGRLLHGLGHTVGIQSSYNGHSIDNLYVAHDDLDIRLGEYKIQKGKGPKEHNGVKSVEEALGTKDFWRIRIGIENRDNGESLSTMKGVKGEEYVLQRFTAEERVILDRVLEEITNEIDKTNNR
ncbi:MAG: peptidyl-tRNA hydrolase [Microgenomates group bacterium Gr01-1014_16]|nr:MAG: peptidyl-tRNA hydrolase [Microgenomates group bacterium Gr01-1014_16]